MRVLTLLVVTVAAVPARWTLASATVTRPFVGVTCTSRVETAPRPLRMHVVDIDLAARGIGFRLTPPAGPLHTRKQTTLDFLRQQRAQIAVNAHFFEPWPAPSTDPGTASLVGIAASDGKVYSPFLDKPPKQYAIGADAPGLNIDANNRASVVHRNPSDPTGYTPAEPVTLYNALAGNEQIVTGGRVTAVSSGWNHRLGPRTAVGLADNRKLILFVVDGRQPGVSEGMSVPEVANLLIGDYRVVDALNLDGGGSTTLAIADPTPRIANVPVGVGDVPGTERAVGSNLAVFALEREPTAATPIDPASTTGPRDPSTTPWIPIAAGTCLAAGLAALICRWRLKRRKA
jgi:hypothetical protein